MLYFRYLLSDSIMIQLHYMFNDAKTVDRTTLDRTTHDQTTLHQNDS